MAPDVDHPGTTPPPSARRRVVLGVLAAMALALAVACGSSGQAPASDASGSAAGDPADGSTDAGPAPEDFQPVSVSFVSADQGFVLGTKICETPPCTSLRATDDGGTTWQPRPAPPAPLALSPADASSSSADDESTSDTSAADQATTNPSTTGTSAIAGEPLGTGTPVDAISELRFGDHLDGWAFGPGLWSTHDGGEHWAAQDLSGTVTDLASADGVTYAVVTNCPSGSCEQGATLYRTDATTDDWQVVDGASLPAEGGQIELHARSAWFVGPSTVDGGGATFLASTDGATWIQHDDPCLADDALLAGVAPVDSTRLFLLCVNDPGAGSQGKSVRLSDDGGATSTAQGSPDRGGIASEIAAADADSLAVAAQSGASFIYRSGDGGRSWATVEDRADGGAGFHDLDLTTPTEGVVIYGEADITATPPSTSRLLMTHDGGTTWTPITLP